VPSHLQAPRSKRPAGSPHAYPGWKAYAALAAVSWLWGTTFLAIRITNEALPAALFACSRFLASGSILLGVCVLLGARLPRGRERLDALFSGALVLGVGSGGWIFAEHYIVSGITALFAATTPLWMVAADAAFPGGRPIHPRTLVGLLTGLGGCALLAGPELARFGFASAYWKGFLITQAGAACWALGSIYSRNRPAQAHPVVNGAFQQLGAGLAWAPAACLLHHGPVLWTVRTAGSFLYLVACGSILGFSAYVYALNHLPVSIASLYSFLNPVVAVWLGWVFYRERFGWHQAGAMAMIFLGVALVKMQETGWAQPAPRWPTPCSKPENENAPAAAAPDGRSLIPPTFDTRSRPPMCSGKKEIDSRSRRSAEAGER
jgi:drug/metabolite transporter (DMT)-like permease